MASWFTFLFSYKEMYFYLCHLIELLHLYIYAFCLWYICTHLYIYAPLTLVGMASMPSSYCCFVPSKEKNIIWSVFVLACSVVGCQMKAFVCHTDNRNHKLTINTLSYQLNKTIKFSELKVKYMHTVLHLNFF